MEKFWRRSKRDGRWLLCCGILALAGCSATAGIATNTGNPGLNGTAWQLLRISSRSEGQAPLSVEQPERYTLHFLADGRLALRLDCNRGSGSWQATPAAGDSGQLSLGPIATTRMFCPQPSLDNEVAQDLGLVRSYRLGDGHLFLNLAADAGSLEWQPLPADQSSKTGDQLQP